MINSQWLKMNVEAYFNNQPILDFIRTIQDESLLSVLDPKAKTTTDIDPLKTMKMPTPEEFAREMGFSNFNSMKKAIENQAYPEESRHYLLVGCSIIADLLTRAGLTNKMNSKFVQFVMSAYMGINEKTEIKQTSDNRVIIEWQTRVTPDFTAPKPLPNTAGEILMMPCPPDATALELDRLEKSLPENMKLPVYRMAPEQQQVEEDA